MKEGWEIKKLGEVADFQRGLTYSKKDEVEESSNIVLRANNINANNSRLDFSDLKYIKKEISIPPEKKVLKGSLIICTASGSKNHLGKVALIDDDYQYAFGGFMGQITPKDNVNSNFLLYILSSHRFRKFIDDLADGVNINNLRFDQLKEYTIPLPHLPEQERIVALLDQAFAAIDTAKKNIEKNLRNTRELFESYLQDIFTHPGEDWELKTFGEIAEIKGGKRVPKGYKFEASPTKFPYIRVSDFNNHGSVDLSNIKYICEQVYRQIKEYTISKNNLYISIAGTIGKTGIIPEELDNANLTENACKLVFKPNIEPKFVYFFTQSNNFMVQAGLNTRVAAMPKLALSRLSKITLSIPKSLLEQHRIINKLDKLSIEIKTLKEIYQQKLVDLEELKQSLLQRAFVGEL